MNKTLPNEAAQVKKRKQLQKALRLFILSLVLCVVLSLVCAVTAHAAGVSIDVAADGEAGNMGVVEIVALFAFLALLPSVVLMMTSFTRIIIVLSFMRQAMGTNQSPPNMILTGLAIFLTLFIMTPVITEMNEVAYQPYRNGELEAGEALAAAAVPVKSFMLRQTDDNTLAMYMDLAGVEPPEVADPANPVELTELSLLTITPAFITSEISRAFMMGFLIFLPFLVLDMVVSSILMSMGMMMLPPAMISMPFKLLLFVLVDGWNLMMGTLVNTF